MQQKAHRLASSSVRKPQSSLLKAVQAKESSNKKAYKEPLTFVQSRKDEVTRRNDLESRLSVYEFNDDNEQLVANVSLLDSSQTSTNAESPVPSRLKRKQERQMQAEKDAIKAGEAEKEVAIDNYSEFHPLNDRQPSNRSVPRRRAAEKVSL